ncbi:MAG: phosphatase PAP2 family protein [Limisphaerales bacterium]
MLSVVLTFFVWAAYLLLQWHPFFPVTILQPSGLDRMIPFVPSTVYLYESLLMLMPIAPWLMKSKAELNQYTRGLLAVSLAGFVFFLLYPTAIVRPKDLQPANFLYRTLIQIDEESNVFPSLHSAFAVFHAACCCVVFRTSSGHNGIRWFFRGWALAIITATLLTKQHVVLDAVAGAALGFAGFAFFYRSPKESWKDTKQS